MTSHLEIDVLLQRIDPNTGFYFYFKTKTKNKAQLFPFYQTILVCVFVSVPQIKPLGSPNVGLEGCVSNRFSTPVSNVMHKIAVLLTASGVSIMEFVILWRQQKLSEFCNPDVELL